jgi:hypothetical protein
MVDLTEANTLSEAVNMFIPDVNTVHNIINEDALTEITIENGTIPSIRKVLADNMQWKSTIEDWTNGTFATDPLQLYLFNGVWYWAPSATIGTTIALGATPVGDNNWKIAPVMNNQTYTFDTIENMQLGKTINGLDITGHLYEGMSIKLTHEVRHGDFTARLAADYTAEIAADTLMGVYVPVTGTEFVLVRERSGDYVYYEWFGGNDQLTQEESTVIVQAVIDSHQSVKLFFGNIKCGNIILPDRNMTITGRFRFYCESAPSDNHYMFASYKYLNNVAEAQTPIVIAPLSGDMRDAVFDGNNLVSHSIISQSWSSYFCVTTTNGLGAGFLDAGETRNGTTFPLSSKVNNRYKIISTSNGGCGFYSKDSARNNATDGTILQGSQFYGNSDYAIYVDAAAGWDIHARTYGNGAGIYTNGFGKGTLIHDCFIDDGAGVVDPLPETGETFSGALIGSAALSINGVGNLKLCDSDINGPVSCKGNGDSSPYGIKSANNKYRSNGYLYHQYFGSSRKLFSDCDEFANSDPFRFHNGSSTGVFNVTNATLSSGRIISGTFNALNKNYKLAHGDSSYSVSDGSLHRVKTENISAGGAFSFNLPIVLRNNYDNVCGKVTLITRTNYNSVVRVSYIAEFVISSKVNGTDAWVVSTIPTLLTTAEWSTAPVFTITDNGDGTGLLNIAGEPSDSDGYGRLNVCWG